jgi:hypothetical protein
MKKYVLPVSERFTIHATALINKVHSRTPAPKKDAQKDMLVLARQASFSYRQADTAAIPTRHGF